MEELKDKVTIITGASFGIGRATAQLLSEKGSDIAIFDIEEPPVIEDIKRKGRKAFFFKVDVSSFPEVERAVEALYQETKRIDFLVNNAGIARDGILLRMKEEDWDRVIDVNLKGVFNCTKAVLKYMIKTGGAIVNVSSIAGITGNRGQANYAASKAGIIGFSKTVAKEYGERNIRVNVVAPGFILTRMTERIDEKIKEEVLKNIPLKRFGTPQDVARVIYFLLSEDAGYITGEVIQVNGGLYM